MGVNGHSHGFVASGQVPYGGAVSSRAPVTYGAPASRRIYAYLTGFQSSRYRGGTPSWAQRPFERNADGTPKYRPAWDVMNDPSGSVFAGPTLPRGGFVPSDCSAPRSGAPSSRGLGFTLDPELFSTITSTVLESGAAVASAVQQGKQAKAAAEAEKAAAKAERTEAAHRRKLELAQAKAAAEEARIRAGKPSDLPLYIGAGVLALGAVVLVAVVARTPRGAAAAPAGPGPWGPGPGPGPWGPGPMGPGPMGPSYYPREAR